MSSQENQVLHSFYNSLLKLIYDNTFCGFLAEIPEWPPYPEKIAGIDSMFGMNSKTIIRIDAAETRACTLGGDNTIQIFERLPDAKLVRVIQWPAALSTAILQDAIFLTSDTLCAVATTGADSIFATIAVNDPSSTWQTTTIAGSTFKALALLEERLYTAAVGKGLFEITNPLGAVAAQQVNEFNAFGHLVSDQVSPLLYATSISPQAAAAGAFDQITVMSSLRQFEPCKLSHFPKASPDPHPTTSPRLQCQVKERMCNSKSGSPPTLRPTARTNRRPDCSPAPPRRVLAGW